MSPLQNRLEGAFYLTQGGFMPAPDSRALQGRFLGAISERM